MADIHRFIFDIDKERTLADRFMKEAEESNYKIEHASYEHRKEGTCIVIRLKLNNLWQYNYMNGYMEGLKAAQKLIMGDHTSDDIQVEQRPTGAAPAVTPTNNLEE